MINTRSFSQTAPRVRREYGQRLLWESKEKLSLPRVSTISTAEVIALRLAVKLVKSGSLEDNFLKRSDSLSAHILENSQTLLVLLGIE